jgi:hypothetical protein
MKLDQILELLRLPQNIAYYVPPKKLIRGLRPPIDFGVGICKEIPLLLHYYSLLLLYYICVLIGGKASTPPDSDEDSNQLELDGDQPRDANDYPQFNDNDPLIPQNVVNERPCPQTGRQKGMAAVMKVNPPEMIAKLTAGFKKSTIRMVEDVRSHYAVSAEEQPDGILSAPMNYGLV